MKGSGTPLIRALERISEQVSDGLVEGKRRLCQLPVVGSTFSKVFKKLPLQTGNVTNIIITGLSYPGMYHAQNDYSMELRGTKYDFVLLLRHFDYRHEGNSVNFTLLNDFEVDFTDSTGVQKIIPNADTSRNSIRKRCTIQKIVRTAERDAKIVFLFGGHGESAEVNMMGGDSGDECDFQTIIAGDGRRIYGKELRSWFCDARYPSISVTAVFDVVEDLSAFLTLITSKEAALKSSKLLVPGSESPWYKYRRLNRTNSPGLTGLKMGITGS
ncbi:hypothetical protein FRC04_003945 [Tulasnella sp. 424]|nr:hypothetical protein FRC04_003945 [Tulasnella sp. 424]KAG8964640.1 hypothetical protein FRC05_003753 [Tulasnella sp. 425]